MIQSTRNTLSEEEKRNDVAIIGRSSLIPQYNLGNHSWVTNNAFERLERSAVKVARSVLRRMAPGNRRHLSD